LSPDQPAISGAWYPEYASGQGFHLHYFADSRTVFMPWFTFASSGGSGAAPLRWYVLQGTVAPGAQTVALDIYRNQGGNFDATPITQSERVGSATLAFSSCERANLDYNFDGTLGLGSGRITLTRLTARDAPCTLADGSVSPPTATTSSAGGFGTRHSGAWYDPATSGQGLMFSVTPASSSNAGYFFAPWFTYDPQDTQDESTRRHWFTIQGDLRNASNGSSEFVIYRTTGGTFDITPATDTSRVGAATVRMIDCQRAQLDFGSTVRENRVEPRHLPARDRARRSTKPFHCVSYSSPVEGLHEIRLAVGVFAATHLAPVFVQHHPRQHPPPNDAHKPTTGYVLPSFRPQSSGSGLTRREYP
jgi:hypothetical protein